MTKKWNECRWFDLPVTKLIDYGMIMKRLYIERFSKAELKRYDEKYSYLFDVKTVEPTMPNQLSEEAAVDEEVEEESHEQSAADTIDSKAEKIRAELADLKLADDEDLTWEEMY